jgi:hypothetical protein
MTTATGNLPALERVGSIRVNETGGIDLAGWKWSGPMLGEPGKIVLTGLAGLAGRSVAELHGLSHGPRCECPVVDVELVVPFDDEDLLWPADDPAPLLEETWQAAPRLPRRSVRRWRLRQPGHKSTIRERFIAHSGHTPPVV